MVSLFGCSSPEPPFITFDTIIQNNSSSAFTLTLELENEVLFQERFDPSTSKTVCIYAEEIFIGIWPECGAMLTIEFDNGKGYKCDRSLIFSQTEPLCFDGKGPQLSVNFEKQAGESYIFYVTEEHFLNARDL